LHSSAKTLVDPHWSFLNCWLENGKLDLYFALRPLGTLRLVE
jgi:hypothetical protein